MSRAVWLALALLLASPVLSAFWTVLSSAAFVVEFLSDGRWRPLSAITRAPEVRPLPAAADGRPIPVDLYARPSLGRPRGLVLVHGLSPEGKDEPRLRRAAALLARTGWAVAVPTVEGMTTLRLRPEDSDTVVAAIAALGREGLTPVAVLGISVGAGPALLAAADPRAVPSVSAVLALGGYASTVELLRYTLTGAYRFDGMVGRHPVNEAGIAVFARANAELVGPAGRSLIANRDPEAVDRLVAALPPETRRLLDALSPERAVGSLRAPLFLIHGGDDPAVPVTETLRLERAARTAGRPVRAVVVGAVGHVDPDERAGWRDLGRLWAAYYAFRMAAGRPISGAGP